MDPRIDTLVRDWSSRSCEPGYTGMQALADAEFSGSISSGAARGFMVNGRLVGITGGTVESFRDAELTAQEADDPAVPLLCAMLLEDATVEGEYYTGDTPIAEVNRTLSSGAFAGYLELSENVFSGDYFVLYHAGTSQSVAILGTEDRVITGSEAFERANDEVGIYEVKSVDIAVTEIPEPEGDDSDAVAGAEPEPDPEPKPSEPEEEPEPASVEADPEPDHVKDPDGAAEPGPTPEAEASTGPERPEEPIDADTGKETREDRDIASLADAALRNTSEESGPFSSGQTAASRADEPIDEWLTIPALDPDRTTLVRAPDEEPEQPEPEPTADPVELEADQPVESPAEAAPEPEPEPEPTDSVEEAVVEQLEATEREKERLESRVEELESRLEEVAADPGGDQVTPYEALDGTNLFVRYDSKANFTLSDAASGGADRDEVQENIRLEWHTTFEDETTTVNGETYAAFLQSSIEYRFAEWLITELLFELRETGGQTGFQDLYEAIPEIDRIEFSGNVPVHTREGSERSSETYDFDVIFRNGMGDPLLIAAVHDSREPADAEAVGTLMADANEVATERQSVGAALFVTSSYFAPEAIGTVADATGGGFLRGSSKESYVSVSRKHGFHLCLVEARNESFHLNVPDS